MTVEEIDVIAKAGTPLPDTASLAESLLYHNLRRLYWEYRHRLVDVTQAKKEKNRLISQFGVEELLTRCVQNDHERWRKYQLIQPEAEKHGCEICRKIVRI